MIVMVKIYKYTGYKGSPIYKKVHSLAKSERKFEQIRTKLAGVPKSLFGSIIKKRTVRVPTNTGNSMSTMPKSLKGVLSKSTVFDSKIQKTSPVNEKGGVNTKTQRHRICNNYESRQKETTIYNATPSDLQPLYKQTEGVYKYF
ncbi:hypothetical protein MA16_Dca028654 [Dendrobium catenatum]|uniref:Uncharacterized protein n=1 Tax=Dendrobium catenatum TaxID=906689 RepID=A0A2I0V6Z1_9ASPA|nr:hypothetical protein MA16_Dca028654 [Dendrobium catenatum]